MIQKRSCLGIVTEARFDELVEDRWEVMGYLECKVVECNFPRHLLWIALFFKGNSVSDELPEDNTKAPAIRPVSKRLRLNSIFGREENNYFSVVWFVFVPSGDLHLAFPIGALNAVNPEKVEGKFLLGLSSLWNSLFFWTNDARPKSAIFKM